MRIRSFRVPFSRVVADDAHELEFGPDDYMVVRPIFGLPAAEVIELGERMSNIGEDEEGAANLIADVLRAAILTWHLTDETGAEIPKPTSKADLDKLPAGLSGAIFTFLSTYRGDAENPTTPR